MTDHGRIEPRDLEAAADLAEEGGDRRILAVAPEDLGKRLDKFLAEQLSGPAALSRTRLQALVSEGAVTFDGQAVVSASRRLDRPGTVIVAVPPPRSAEPNPEAIPLDVVFEDDHLIVLDKPAGLVVHPAAGHESGTLVNALLAHCGDSLSGIGGIRRPGIVHRIDKDTSGLLVVAKTDVAHQGLAALFADHGRSGSLERAYLAFTWGTPERLSGTVELRLGRHPHQRDRMAVVKGEAGRHAVTHWAVEERYGPEASLIRCELETGRTHQIRVHLAAIGHPLMGDPVYGTGFRTKAARLSPSARGAVEKLGRQALHAAVLGFEHPVTGEVLHFESPLPVDLQMLERALEDGRP